MCEKKNSQQWGDMLLHSKNFRQFKKKKHKNLIFFFLEELCV